LHGLSLLQIAHRALGAAAAAGVLFAPVACHRATAPPVPSPQAKQAAPAPPGIDQDMASLYAASGAIGMVVAVVDGDSITTRGFGRMGLKDKRVPDGRTLVRLQSISKLFSSDLLATLVAQGKVTLRDPLQSHAPPGGVVPAPRRGGPITLLNLATHTSGLPREAGIDPPPPNMAIAARWNWLGRERGRPAPGVQALYSNIGFELLGDALSNATRESYNDALDAAVTGPLGMVDTTARPTPEECSRLMSPDPRRGLYPCIDQTPEAASGGLYSTADDMALWMKAQLAAGPTGLTRNVSQAVYVRRTALARAVGIDYAGQASGIGLAWLEVQPDGTHPRILEKDGGGDGFLTYIVIDPIHRIGVFVAFNNESGHRLPTVARDADVLVGRLAAQQGA